MKEVRGMRLENRVLLLLVGWNRPVTRLISPILVSFHSHFGSLFWIFGVLGN